MATVDGFSSANFTFRTFRFPFSFAAEWTTRHARPTFKLYWENDSARKESIMTQLRSKVKCRVDPLPSGDSTNKLSPLVDFFSFEKSMSSDKDEIDNYMCDPDCSISMLERYPNIKSLCVKWNTTLPSSAPVERLFSQSVLVLTARRNRKK